MAQSIMTGHILYNEDLEKQSLSPPNRSSIAMFTITGPAQTADIEADFWRELAEIEAESIGWLALDGGCYLHTGADSAEILIVGTASANMASSNMLWVY